MHVRASLSHPRVVEALRPFIVSFWGQQDREPIPDGIKEFYDVTGRVNTNARCFVLDADGRCVGGFAGFPDGASNPTGYSPDERADYLAGEIRRLSRKLELKPREAVLRLPDVKEGVRLFIRLKDGPDSYRTPVVEAVEGGEEKAVLARPERALKIDAAKFARWLRLVYPPGVNEQLKPYEKVEGTLTLAPADGGRAILSGSVRMDRAFEGTLRAVLTYEGAVIRLRGVVEGVYPRFDKPRNAWRDWKLTAAIESRPE